VHLPAYDPAVTCAALGASKGRNYSDVWYLELYIDWVAPRMEASIGTAFPPNGIDAVAAYVDIVHDNGSKWTVNSPGGKVTLTSAPSSETDQVMGVQVRGHVDFTFPTQPRALTSCEGWVSLADGGGTQGEQTCTCVDLAGNTSTCAAGMGENCCTPLTSDVESFSVDITANSCGLFCTTTPGDPNNCAELYGG
jgi:hypothetical protein